MGNSGCFPRGNRAAIVWRYPVVFFPVYSVFVFPYHRLCMRPTLLQQMDIGSVTCAQISWERAVHTKGCQTQTSLHKTNRRDRKKCLTLPPGVESRVFTLEFRLSNHWASSPVFHGPTTEVAHKKTIIKKRRRNRKSPCSLSAIRPVSVPGRSCMGDLSTWNICLALSKFSISKIAHAIHPELFGLGIFSFFLLRGFALEA